MTARAFIVADSNKRRTLSRSDISRAIAKSDQFDFLIDILPREEPIASAPSYHSAVNRRHRKKDEEVSIVPVFLLIDSQLVALLAQKPASSPCRAGGC